ncbi:CW-type zinc finger [Actinidia rufa]|uniref:CW-type zinc finger n=1 Tax=Actinidia rufa TaxID=165716 RepID=A0A7J0F352_9ERIC|nr:CW-type zinc finger [Actinidia rufa]
MAAAPLAYKCMAVAYMRVIFSSHASARRDQHELHRDLKNVPPPGNRPIVRLLNFARDADSAMEASRKSRIAFTSANRRVEDERFKEGITSVKRALDFSFLDVEGLLWLVRLALEAISR